MSPKPTARHPVARGFDRVAEGYERGRPGYPAPAVRFLARLLGARRGRTVVELGSGTGKLTRSLVGLGPAIVAVEPSEAMRRVFERVLPDVLALDGTAEAIPLPNGSADGVVAAQAFHWFRARAALREIGRVLRPGGTVVLLWNVRDERDPLNRELDALVDRHAAARPGRWRHWEEAFRPTRRPFGPLYRRLFGHARSTTVRQIVEHLLSVSRVALLPAAQRRALAREARRLFASRGFPRPDDRLEIPTVTELYWARRTAGGPPTRRSGRTRRTRRTSRGSARPARRTARPRDA